MRGACAFADSGSSPEPATLDECAEQCKKCTRCNYVSFSRAAADCSWYYACRAPLRRRVGSARLEGTFHTLRVRETSEE